ncbi:MAG: putative LPS assembly protein LptD [Porphyromonas sp.]|nr:putative LPS assembly protein LptD [Porphyromonas sp.]
MKQHRRSIAIYTLVLGYIILSSRLSIMGMTRSGALLLQEWQVPRDSLLAGRDSIVGDSLRSDLQAPISFESTDSIVVLPKRSLVRLYGDAKAQYEGQDLQGDYMHLQTDSGTIFSTYIDYPDSLKRPRIYAKIKRGEEEYEAKSLTYNFHSERGYITDVITRQGDGFITAKRTKRMENEDLFMEDGRYTTCDLHDHPHFYIALTRAKARPEKDVVSGPLYLVLADVPLPIGLPFGYFPFTTSRSSGIIVPTYGDEMDRGFYLRNGGYYFAINDYVDLQLTGDIYTKGSWGLSTQATYRKRYRYSGSLNANYIVTKRGDKVAGDYSKATDFRIAWSHQQDPKANPYRTLSANVNFSTSSYNHNNLESLYNQAVMGENTKSSSISFTQRFPNNPWSISGSIDVTQRSRDSAIAVTLPNLSVTMSRIYPFKRKQQVGRERWYEKISLSYSGQLRNYIDTKEDKLLKSNLMRDWRNGVNHSVPVSASFDLFQYFKVTPSFSYQERWYTSKIEKAYDPEKNRVMTTDTIQGFNRVYDFRGSVALSTTVYGFWKPMPFLGNKVDMIRHRMEPSVSINYQPDFGDPRYGYWEELNYITRDGRRETHRYSPFEGQLFGVPSPGKSGSVSMSVSNNVEAKVRSKKDSTSFDKVSLIEDLSFSTSYNLAADSFQWSDFSARLAIRLSDSFTLRVGGSFDPYLYDYHEHDGRISPYRVDQLRIMNGKGFGRFRGTSTSFSYTLNPQNLKKLLAIFDRESDKNDGDEEGDRDNGRDRGDGSPREDGMGAPANSGGGSLLGQSDNALGEYDADGYLVNKIDWSVGFNYGLSLGWGDFDPNIREYKYKWRHDLSFNGSFRPTKNWNFTFSANYNFDEKRVTNMSCNITRNLHCWNMSASFIPIGPYKSYNFSIQVNSQLLQDLRYRKSSQPSYGRGSTWYQRR